MDHSFAIRNAFTSAFPDAYLVDCWAHVVRKAQDRSKMPLPHGCGIMYFKLAVKPMLDVMNQCGSKDILMILGKVALDKWRSDGHHLYAKWFQKVYLSAGWEGWWCGAAGVPGTSESNNALEALNRDIKRELPQRATMSHFMSHCIPMLLLRCSLKRTPAMMYRDVKHNQLSLINTGFVPHCVFHKAISLINCVEDNTYECIQRIGGELVTKIFVNSGHSLK
jgi:hypothetical protein